MTDPCVRHHAACCASPQMCVQCYTFSPMPQQFVYTMVHVSKTFVALGVTQSFAADTQQN